MRKGMVLALVVLLFIGTPGYWVWTDEIPSFLKATQVGRLVDDLSWEIHTYIALKKGEKPEKTVEAFYKALEEGDYYKAESYVAPESIEYLNAQLLEGTSFNIKSFSIIKLQIMQDRSRVQVLVNGNRGQAFTLVKKFGQWQVQSYGDDASIEI